MWKDVTLHFWIWISTFKGTGNRLPKHCNRLQLFEINWNVVNWIWKLFQKNFATGNRLQLSGNRLPESKNSLVNMFLCKIHVLLSFWKILFILILIKSSLDSWILNLDLDSWIHPFSWILKCSSTFPLESWICSWFLLEYLALILWLTFELFVITLVIIFCYHHCYHQNIFESLLIHHEALLLQSPPFWWWQLLKSRNTHTLFPSRSLT